MFFSLDESAGFAVAGGAALIARALVDRSTQDVDLFSGAPPVVPIPDVVRAFTRAAVAEGWLVQQLRLSDSFARLAVEADGEVTVVDLGLDSPPDEPPSITELGPTLAARDLAARKVLALFGRAEARTSPMSATSPTSTSRTSYYVSLAPKTRASTLVFSPT